uniref:Uncharacterized protein n=1 Tax=Rhizophora mucronata TaxID=61149 RepID=A0A2P2JW66_RHIMU
MKQRSRASA